MGLLATGQVVVFVKCLNGYIVLTTWCADDVDV